MRLVSGLSICLSYGGKTGQGQGGWSLLLVGASFQWVLVNLGGCSLVPVGVGKLNVIFI